MSSWFLYRLIIDYDKDNFRLLLVFLHKFTNRGAFAYTFRNYLLT